jgi:hypothetical protein
VDGPIAGAHIERDPRSGEDLRPNSDGMQCLGGQGAGAAWGKVSASHMGPSRRRELQRRAGPIEAHALTESQTREVPNRRGPLVHLLLGSGRMSPG